MMNKPVELAPLLVTPRQAAKVLSVCERTLWNWTKSGLLRRVKVGHLVRYSIDDLNAFIRDQQQFENSNDRT